MSISDKMEQAINKQIQKEFYSSYLYLAMAAYMENKNSPGFAAWLKVQSTEETQHGMRLYKFLLDRGGRVELEALDKPPAEFGNPLDLFETALGHEKKVTASINDLYETALNEKDYPAQVELQWFINDQVEEEKTFGEIVQQLKAAGDKPQFLLMLDRQLAQRGAEEGGGED